MIDEAFHEVGFTYESYYDFWKKKDFGYPMEMIFLNSRSKPLNTYWKVIIHLMKSLKQPKSTVKPMKNI